MQKPSSAGGNFLDGQIECRFVGFGRFVKSTDFSYELQRSVSYFGGGDRRIKIEEIFDISTHSEGLPGNASNRLAIHRLLRYAGLVCRKETSSQFPFRTDV